MYMRHAICVSLGLLLISLSVLIMHLLEVWLEIDFWGVAFYAVGAPSGLACCRLFKFMGQVEYRVGMPTTYRPPPSQRFMQVYSTDPDYNGDDDPIVQEACRRAFESGGVVFGSRNEDGSISWSEPRRKSDGPGEQAEGS